MMNTATLRLCLALGCLIGCVYPGWTAPSARDRSAAAGDRSAASPHARSVGIVVVMSDPAALARSGALLTDELLTRLARADIDSTCLDAKSALLAAEGSALPDLSQPASWADSQPQLLGTARALGFTDLAVVYLAAKAGSKKLTAQAMWLTAAGGVDVFPVVAPGDVSDDTSRQVADDVASHLINSPAPSTTIQPASTGGSPKPAAQNLASDQTPVTVKPGTTDQQATPSTDANGKPGDTTTGKTSPPSDTGPTTTAPTGKPAVEPTGQGKAEPEGKPDTPDGKVREPAELPPSYDAAIRALGEDDLRRAMDDADRALDEGAPRGRVCLLRAMIYAAKHDTAGEMRELDAAIDADPKLIEPRLKLAELETDRGRWQRAIELYKGAIAEDKTVGAAYIGLARVYEVNRQPRAAQETLEQGAQATPQDGLVLIELADHYNRHGLTRQAEVAYTNAARVGSPKLRADALQKLGDVYAATQRYREAFICYAELARSHDPSASVMADKRYHQVMDVVDKAVGKALDIAFEALDKYTPQTPQITRVEALEVISESVKQLKDMSAFTSDILPPSSLKTENAQRALYYSLAQEAAVAAQAYIDTGDKDVLQAAHQRRSDAHDEQTRLAGMAGK